MLLLYQISFAMPPGALASHHCFCSFKSAAQHLFPKSQVSRCLHLFFPMFHEAKANRWLVKGIICTLWWEFSALLSWNVLTRQRLCYTWHCCVLCHLTIVLSAWFTWDGKCLIRGERVSMHVMQDGAMIPTFHVCTQLPGWVAVSVEGCLQQGCIYLGVLAHFSDYWCTVGSFAAVVYFTSCGCIPVVVVSGTGWLFAVVRTYGILSL